MTSRTTDASPALSRIREIALLLPEVEERDSQGRPTFFVADSQFAHVREPDQGSCVVCVRTSGADEQAMLIDAAPATYAMPADPEATGWVDLTVDGDPDWALIEDRIAHSWELAAPRRLLEAGGR